MLLHGDEIGRTQQGNNNTYAQDSEISWIHWDHADVPLNEFTAAVSRLRKEHPTFRRSRFFDGRPVRRGKGEPLPDIVWLNSDAREMEPEEWDAPLSRSVGVFLNGQGIRGRDQRGQRITDVNFLVYFNAEPQDVDFVLPPGEYSQSWDVVIDSAGQAADGPLRSANEKVRVLAKSLVVLRAHQEAVTEADHSVAASLTAMTGTIETIPLTKPSNG
jgi:glycogen operon protein